LRELLLTREEALSLLELIDEEREKNRRFGEVIASDRGGVVPSDNRLADLAPATGTITGGEVRRGKAFLRFLGHGGVAARLGFWEGSGGDFHAVDPDEGCEDFLADFDRWGGSGSEGGGAKELLLSVSGSELLVRLDPPANTLNPHRLEGGAPPARAGELGGLPKPLSVGLHPANYCIEGRSGKRYSVLDKSDWAGWEALRDASLIPDRTLTVLTANSVVPDPVLFLDRGQLAALDAAAAEAPPHAAEQAPAPAPADQAPAVADQAPAPAEHAPAPAPAPAPDPRPPPEMAAAAAAESLRRALDSWAHFPPADAEEVAAPVWYSGTQADS
jgi:hypothetical protein